MRRFRGSVGIILAGCFHLPVPGERLHRTSSRAGDPLSLRREDLAACPPRIRTAFDLHRRGRGITLPRSHSHQLKSVSWPHSLAQFH